MKHTRIISGALLSAGILLFACKDEPKNADSEKVAKEANDDKIETNTFEKDAEALVKLSSQDQYLVNASDFAVKNANQKQVKQLALSIASDHNNLNSEIKSLAQNFQPITPTEYLTRQETAEILKVSLVTLSDWNKKKILNPYRLGNLIRYKRSEIEQALISINAKKL